MLTRRTILAAPALALPANQSTSTELEQPIERVHRLCAELQDALAESHNGQFMAMVWPAGYREGYVLRTTRLTPELRVEFAAADLSAALLAMHGGDWRTLLAHDCHMVAIIDRGWRPCA